MELSGIKNQLLSKAALKQLVYKQTVSEFNRLKKIAAEICNNLNENSEIEKNNVIVKIYEKGDFEFHLKFGSDTLVFMLHTNIFNFEPGHFIFDSEYIKADQTREYCGMIQVYNFLSDSLKYNRQNDLGYLIARIFINKDLHFFIEGKRPLSVKYNNIECCQINDYNLNDIILEAMHYCINFDLMVPPIELVNYLSVEQKNVLSFSSGMPTGKRLGFNMQTDNEIE
ncbi:MAG: hypothetical protein ACK4K9_10780 [Bacteroidia bacterium]